MATNNNDRFYVKKDGGFYQLGIFYFNSLPLSIIIPNSICCGCGEDTIKIKTFSTYYKSNHGINYSKEFDFPYCDKCFDRYPLIDFKVTSDIALNLISVTLYSRKFAEIFARLNNKEELFHFQMVINFLFGKSDEVPSDEIISWLNNEIDGQNELIVILCEKYVKNFLEILNRTHLIKLKILPEIFNNKLEELRKNKNSIMRWIVFLLIPIIFVIFLATVFIFPQHFVTIISWMDNHNNLAHLSIIPIFLSIPSFAFLYRLLSINRSINRLLLLNKSRN